MIRYQIRLGRNGRNLLWSNQAWEIPVQINGKVKVKISISPDTPREEMMELALADDRVKALIEGKTIVKQIAVPGRLVNLVVK